MIDSTLLLAPLAVGFFTTVIGTIILLPLIRHFKLVDDPATHRHPALLHRHPIPRGGGIAMTIGVLIVLAVLSPLSTVSVALIVAAGIMVCVGILDDRFDIPWSVRLGANILSSCIVVGSGITIPFITHPLGGILLLDTPLIGSVTAGDVIAVVWLTWMMNLLNWSKGVNGQMPGTVAIAAIVIALTSLRYPLSDPATTLTVILSMAIAGSALGFLPFNLHPARMFPGYSATGLYLLLAAAAILSSAKLATAFLVLAIPVIDGIVTIIRRLLRGTSPFRGDNKHLHHLLLKKGWHPTAIAVTYWSLALLFGILALALGSREKFFAILMLTVMIGGGIIFLLYSLNEHRS